MSKHNLILILLTVEKRRYAFHTPVYFLFMKGMFLINKMSQFEMVLITWTGKHV